MAHPEAQDEATSGRRRYQRCALGAYVGVAQVHVGYPGPNLDPLRRGAHQLGRCHRIVVDLSREDRLEPSGFGFARDVLNVLRIPPDGSHGYYRKPESFVFHISSLFAWV